MRYKIIPSGLDYVNENAKVIIVGKTPGQNQMNTDIAGLSPKEVKKTRAFAGPLRKNLVKMLDYIGVNTFLKIDSCISLWGEDYEQNADFTSILKGCVLDTKKEKNKYISKIPLPMNKYPEIENEFDKGFALDCLQYNKAVIWVALGPDVEKILRSLREQGKIKEESVIISIPHPSGANARRISAFLGNNKKEGDIESRAREQAKYCILLMKNLIENDN